MKPIGDPFPRPDAAFCEAMQAGSANLLRAVQDARAGKTPRVRKSPAGLPPQGSVRRSKQVHAYTRGPYRPWLAEEVRRMKRYWKAGLSAKAIGEQLGRSGNSVIGKLHREGELGR